MASKNKKTIKQFERWIEKTAKEYLSLVGLSLMDVEVLRDEGIKDPDTMRISCRYPYCDYCVISYKKESFEDWKDGMLDKWVIVHEICHLLTDPLYCKALKRYIGETEIEDERERLTDTIMLIIKKLESNH